MCVCACVCERERERVCESLCERQGVRCVSESVRACVRVRAHV